MVLPSTRSCITRHRFRYYASGQNGQAMYSMNHLQTLVVKGDNLDAFHNTWNMVMSGFSHVPEDNALQLFGTFGRLSTSNPMSEDIAHYKRAKYEPGNLVYPFEYLWAA